MIDRASVRSTISSQKQGRHIRGSGNYNGGGYFGSAGDAQKVLDSFHDGSAQVLGATKNGHIVIRSKAAAGYNNNPGARYVDQATDVFMIKGTINPSVVPANPNWSP